jgi:DNA-binding CsgD family transcriptional regulator/PAS domain-containing protein
MFSLNTQLTSGITLHRTRRQGDYEHAHIERLEFLLPHLQRAVSIAFRLETFGAMQRMSFQLLDAHTAGIVVLDERGQVVFANRAVQTLTSAQDGIALSKQGFSLRNQVDQRKLQELIARALALVDRAVREPAGFMQLYRASGKRPYSVLVAPLCRGNAILNQARPAVCVVITDPESDPGLTAEMLHTLYGLTGAEARLASAIAAGKRLQSAAEELGITYKTARTHLVSIFRKTGTARQGELVRLLLSEVWPKI